MHNVFKKRSVSRLLRPNAHFVNRKLLPPTDGVNEKSLMAFKKKKNPKRIKGNLLSEQKYT